MKNETTFDVYAYVFSNGTLFSAGKENNKWVKKWDANKQTITVAAGDSVTGKLYCMVTNASNGIYNLRLRVKYNVSKIDVTRSITVSNSINLTINNNDIHKMYISSKDINNMIKENITEKRQKSSDVSGMIVSKRHTFWDDILNFLSHIINIFNIITGP